MTTIYLGPEEHDLIAGLAAHELSKTRHSLDGFGVVWIVYTLWAALNIRSVVSIQSFSRLK